MRLSAPSSRIPSSLFAFILQGDLEAAREAFGAFLRDYAWARQVADVPEGFLPAGPIR